MSALSVLGLRPVRPPNELRYAGGPGHTESYFLRANHPSRPLALWLKVTVYAPLVGDVVAETWLIWFDGERGTTVTNRTTSPFAQARFAGDLLHVSTYEIELGDDGFARGSATGPGGEARFDLRWTRQPGPVGEPLSIYPGRLLREGPLPKFKVLTPGPWLNFSGRIWVAGEEVVVDAWPGMQGHNWGPAHSIEYTWGQCVFPASDGGTETMVEAGTGRLKLAGLLTPRLSVMVVRRGDQTFRFNRLSDLMRHEVSITEDRYTLRAESADGEARLRVDGAGRPMVCLGYRNPDGHLSYCFNTKIADVLLEVRPSKGEPFTVQSRFGGALELLREEPNGKFQVV